jgi:hypothetical protein
MITSATEIDDVRGLRPARQGRGETSITAKWNWYAEHEIRPGKAKNFHSKRLNTIPANTNISATSAHRLVRFGHPRARPASAIMPQRTPTIASVAGCAELCEENNIANSAMTSTKIGNWVRSE